MTITKDKIIRSDQVNWDGLSSTYSKRDSTGGTIVGLKLGVEVDVLQVYGAGVNYNNDTITKCIQAIGSNSVTLVFQPGTWTISSDLTIASNFTCRIPAGVVFSVSSGKTLTFSGPVIRDSNAWTSGSGTVTENGTRYFTGLLDLTGAVLQGSQPLVFEGSSANAFETSIIITNPTADRTITFPDANVDLTNVLTAAGSYTIAGAWTFSGDTTFSSNLLVTGTLQVTTGSLQFEGTTADAFETTLVVTDPTADRTVTLPDATGTVILHNASHGVQVFTGSGTFNVPAGVGWLWVTATAAGGGGGDSKGATGKGGAGGGAGEWCIRKQVPVTPGAAITVTLGAAGVASSGTGTSNGGDAADLTFGSLFTLDGGHGGLADGGAAGAGGTGNGSYPGMAGQIGAQGAGSSSGGNGGDAGSFQSQQATATGNGPQAALWGGAMFGQGGIAPAVTTAGSAGKGYGAGGSGGSGGSSAGAAGQGAYLVVEY